MKRLLLPRTRGWGGARKNAGRKPKGAKAGVSHRARPPLNAKYPVHVTLRVRDHVLDLRRKQTFAALRHSFELGRDKFGFRLNHFSVQGNHLHLVVEANDRRALSRGMQGLAIRMARALNRLMGTNGSVFADHYHSRILKTPTEVLNVLLYQLHNRVKHLNAHFRVGWVDPYCSWGVADPPTVAPRTWLLSSGWRRVVQVPPERRL